MPPSVLPIHSAGSSPTISARGIRKRVCKACDRCRLKKGKCDGANQCSRCKTDNAICVFGERRRSQEKNYPKGYAEMLEQQQAQLVSALTEMYYQLRKASAWEGPSLDESDGHPSTHAILSALDLLDIDGKFNDLQVFEEACDKRDFKMNLDHASIARRRLHAQANSKVAHSYQERAVATMPGDRKSIQPEQSSPTPSFDRPSVTSSLATQSTFLTWEASLQLPNTEASVAQRISFQESPTFMNDKRPAISEWEHALVKMNETFQAYCDEPKPFGASGSTWEPAPLPLDSHRYLLASDNTFKMPDSYDLFHFDWIECDSSWQPEMATWAT